MRKLIDKITDWLVKWGIDVYIHILCVMFVAAIVARVCLLTGAVRPLAACVGVAVGMLVGFFKEFIDVKTTKKIEPKDYAADFIGVVLFFFIFI